MKKRIILSLILFSIIIVSLPVSTNAASYKKAYRKVVTSFEKKYKENGYDKCTYNLIYIDKDKKPELICMAIKLMPNSKNTWYSYVEYHTFYSGEARCFCNYLNNPMRPQSSLPFYQPKKNLFGFRCWDQGSISDVFRDIKKGKSSIKRTETYGRTGDINNPPLNSKYKWIKGKYSKKRILKKLK